METSRQEERQQLIDRVLRQDPQTLLYAGLGGNIGLVYSDLDRQVREGAVEWRVFGDTYVIQRVAVAAVKRGALTRNPRSVEAFREAFSGDAAQKSGIGANEQIILTQLAARRLDCTVENIVALIGELWEQLADNPQYTAQKFVSDQRARRIAEMTQNGTHGFSIQRGPRKYAYDKDGRPNDHNKGMTQGGTMAIKGPWSHGAGKSFDEMSDAEVDALYQEWKTTTDLRAMSPEQLRAIVKSGGHTDAFGNHQSLRVTNSTSADDDPAALINPETNPPREFTQKELIRYINVAPYNGRNLITHKASGKVIPAKRQRFEDIIKGLRG